MGTRRSELALAQAREIAEQLKGLGVQSELVPMVTSGDRGAAPGTSPAGVKGLFVAEIVRAVQRGRCDLAVHSAKDLPSEDPDGIVVAAVPERASPLDVLVSRDPELRGGARVGSSSLRRRGQLIRSRPYQVVEIRGNVDTRLRKMQEGRVDGLVLAAAGLARLGVVPAHAETLPQEEMVPAPGQGALAVQARADSAVREAVARLEHRPSRLAFDAERMLVRLVGGGCALPLGALATLRDGQVHVVAVVMRPDGSGFLRADATADAPESAARDVAELLLSQGARQILQDHR